MADHTVMLMELRYSMRMAGIEDTNIDILANLYTECTSRVRKEDNLSENFVVSKELRQRSAMSLTLFKIFMTKLLKRYGYTAVWAFL